MVTMPSVPVKPLYQMATSLPTSTVAPIQTPVGLSNQKCLHS